MVRAARAGSEETPPPLAWRRGDVTRGRATHVGRDRRGPAAGEEGRVGEVEEKARHGGGGVKGVARAVGEREREGFILYADHCLIAGWVIMLRINGVCYYFIHHSCGPIVCGTFFYA